MNFVIRSPFRIVVEVTGGKSNYFFVKFVCLRLRLFIPMNTFSVMAGRFRKSVEPVGLLSNEAEVPVLFV